MTTKKFQTAVWNHYCKHGRHDLPWRKNITPYRILVSELMLQQTQVSRVIPKYKDFIRCFPSFRALAKASTKEVLAAWQGLGYNRRALALQKTAEIITRKYQGRLPSSPEALIALPGIGPNTAGSIAAFAFNQPAIFIETNIRSVFLHHFFRDREGVDDREILPLVEKTLDRKNARAWYWALMDYGVFLKQTLPNPSRRSKHHAKQSKFAGSRRQLRGQIIKSLLEQSLSLGELKKITRRSESDIKDALWAFQQEKTIHRKGRRFFIV